MHLFKKSLKYAFAYAFMQIHIYPKPSDNIFTKMYLQTSKAQKKVQSFKNFEIFFG
jgi:hypothetical protein